MVCTAPSAVTNVAIAAASSGPTSANGDAPGSVSAHLLTVVTRVESLKADAGIAERGGEGHALDGAQQAQLAVQAHAASAIGDPDVEMGRPASRRDDGDAAERLAERARCDAREIAQGSRAQGDETTAARATRPRRVAGSR